MKKAAFALLFLAWPAAALQQTYTVFNPFTGKPDYVNTSTANVTAQLPLPSGGTNYVNVGSSLQSGATYYVSSGTVAGQLQAGSGKILGTGAGAIALREGNSSTVQHAGQGAFVLWADSVTHTAMFSPGGVSTYTFVGSSSPVNIGECVQFAGQFAVKGTGAPCALERYKLEPSTITPHLDVGVDVSTAIFRSTVTLNNVVRTIFTNVSTITLSTAYFDLSASTAAFGPTLLGGSYGTNGQVYTSGGSGAQASWTTVSGGGGGSSALQTTQSGVQITSPTATLNFAGPPFILGAAGSTTTVKLDGSSATLQGVVTAGTLGALTTSSATATYLQQSSAAVTYAPISGSSNYIWNTSSPQTGTVVANISSATVRGTINLGSQLIFGTGSGAGHNTYSTIYRDVLTDVATSGLDNGFGYFWNSANEEMMRLSNPTGTLVVKYGITAASATISSLTSGQCVQAGTGGALTVTGSACATTTGFASLSSTNTWTAQQTFNNTVIISTTIGLGAAGTVGTLGNTLQSAGPGATPTWSALNIGGGSAYVSGTLAAAQEPAHTGDVTNSAGSLAMTAAALQANITTFSSSVTVNGPLGIKSLYGASFGSATVQNLTGSLPVQTDGSKNFTSAAIDVSGSQATGVLAAARFPALTGDVTTVSGALATTAAALQSNITTLGASSATVSGASGLKVNIGVAFTQTYKAALCQSGTASLGFSAFSTSAPVVSCSISTSTVMGLASFVDNSTMSVQDHFLLPTDWTGAVNANIVWNSTITANDVVWKLRTGCAADAEHPAVTWNAFSSVTDTAKAIASQLNTATISSVSTTNCSAGEEMFFELVRDPANSSDTLASTANLVTFQLTLRRTLTL